MEKQTILVVDDESNIRTLVRRMLNDYYTVLEASNGKEAISIAQNQKPALVLMDIMMPVVDGYTACSALKNDLMTRDIPVIMVSGVGFELNRKLATDIGADGYVSKPFNLHDLIQVIKQHTQPADR